MRLMFASLLLLSAAPLAAQIATPERPVTDPGTLESPTNPEAREVPLEDIGNSRGISGVTWSADGKHVFLSTNLTGRYNIWRTDADGSWPLQMTQSDESQVGLATSGDGKWLYFRQDNGGDEYYDVYRVPTGGGAVERVTNTPDLSETGLLPGGADGAIALSTKTRSEAQANLAVLAPDGTVRTLTAEADPAFGWSARVWADGGTTIYANRDKIDSTTTEVWRVDVATGKAERVLGADGTIYALADISPDGKWLAVTTDAETGRPHAGLYNLAAKQWKWLKPIVWDQSALRFTRDGKSLLVESSDDLRSKLVRVDLASGTETALKLPQGINFTSGAEPRSPDGASLLVVNMAANVSGELNRYDLATDTATPITQLVLASVRPTPASMAPASARS
jgi:Tol biopolymer transport system component